MSDLISRSALIMRLNDYALQVAPFRDMKSTWQYDAVQECIKAVEEQLTVEPVRGEWIYTPTYREYECSNCKSMINLSDDANAHLNFCPQCGADMRKKVKE